MVTEAKKRANAKWQAANMKLVGVKMRDSLAAEFEAVCTKNGTTRNAVLLDYVRRYVAAGGVPDRPADADTATTPED